MFVNIIKLHNPRIHFVSIQFVYIYIYSVRKRFDANWYLLIAMLSVSRSTYAFHEFLYLMVVVFILFFFWRCLCLCVCSFFELCFAMVCPPAFRKIIISIWSFVSVVRFLHSASLLIFYFRLPLLWFWCHHQKLVYLCNTQTGVTVCECFFLSFSFLCCISFFSIVSLAIWLSDIHTYTIW